jgi:hypothetical protein
MRIAGSACRICDAVSVGDGGVVDIGSLASLLSTSTQLSHVWLIP